MPGDQGAPARAFPDATRRRLEELTLTFIGEGRAGASPQVQSMVPD